MGLLVEDLLLLARLDAQRPLEHHRVDLLALASDAVHDAQSIAPKRADHAWRSSTARARPRCSVTRRGCGRCWATWSPTRCSTRRRRADHGAGRHRRRQRGPRGGRRGAGHERRGRAAGVRALLPHRLVARAGQRRHRTRAVDRRLAGVRARRHGQRHHRAGAGLPLPGQPAAHRRRAGAPSVEPAESVELGQRGLDLGLRLVERFRRRVAVDVRRSRSRPGRARGTRGRAGAVPRGRR